MEIIKNNVFFKDGYFMGKKSLEIYYGQYEVENSKASIVISHGFCESLVRYKEIIKIFNQNNFSVYALDHRGHGKSGRLGIDNSQVDVESFIDYIDDLKTFLDSVVVPYSNNRQIFLFAHSMGGAIGSMFLEQYSEYFDCAILNAPMMQIDTGNYPESFSKIVSKFMCMIRQGSKYILGNTPFTGKPDLIGSGTSSEKRYYVYFNKQIQYDYLQTSGGSFNWLNQSFKAMKYITKEKNASKVEIPIVLFQAERDRYVKPKGQRKFADSAKNCELVLIKNSKHEIYLERDEIFNPYIEQVINFYNKNLKLSYNK